MTGAAPDDQSKILHDEEQTEGCEHGVAFEDRGRFGRSPQRGIEYAIDDKADGKKERGAEKHRNQRGDTGTGEERPGAKSTQHDKLAVGYVQNPGHTILQAEANSNEGEYAAREQAANRYVQEPHNHNRYLRCFASSKLSVPKPFRPADPFFRNVEVHSTNRLSPSPESRPPGGISRRPFLPVYRCYDPAISSGGGGGCQAGFGYIGFAVLSCAHVYDLPGSVLPLAYLTGVVQEDVFGEAKGPQGRLVGLRCHDVSYLRLVQGPCLFYGLLEKLERRVVEERAPTLGLDAPISWCTYRRTPLPREKS